MPLRRRSTRGQAARSDARVHDLVDEYSLAVFPLNLGGGNRLFADDGVLRRLRLIDSKPTSTGGILLTYRPDR